MCTYFTLGRWQNPAMKKLLLGSLLLLVACATPPNPLQIAKWTAAAQTAIAVLQTAEKLTADQAADLSQLIETGKLKESTVVVNALAKAGKITPAETPGARLRRTYRRLSRASRTPTE